MLRSRAATAVRPSGQTVTSWPMRSSSMLHELLQRAFVVGEEQLQTFAFACSIGWSDVGGSGLCTVQSMAMRLATVFEFLALRARAAICG